MTNREIASHLRKTISEPGRNTDDTRVSDRELLFLFNLVGTRLLKEEKDLDKYKKIICIELEEVDAGSCGIKTGCTVMKSVDTISNTVKGNDWEVMPITNSNAVNFTKVSWGNDFTSSSRYSYIEEVPYTFRDDGNGDHLYLFNSSIKRVNLEGVPETTIDISNPERCSKPLDDKFNLDESLSHRAIAIVLDTYFKAHNSLRNDEINNDEFLSGISNGQAQT